MSLKSNIVFCLLITVLLGASCHNSDTVFKSLSSSKTNIKFENKLEKKPLFSILYYLYYYNGGGTATGDINNDGLPDIYFTANSNGNNKLYLNKGNLEFEDITEKAGVQGIADWCTGVTMADVNGDGFLDIYVSAVAQTFGLQGHNQLYINNGKTGDDISFTESAAQYGLDFSGFTTQAAFFDYDHDGDLDCYLLNQSHKPNQNIVDTSNRRKFDPLTGDRLYRNDLNTAQKKFTDVSAESGIYQSSLGYGLGIAVSDINNDGWDDIYIGNDFHENDYYYVNNGNGKFTESGAKYFNHYSRFSMGNDVADYNNDGQLDVITVDMLPPEEKVLKTYGSDENADIYKYKLLKNGFQYQYSKNCLQRNNGSGSSFSETSLLSGVAASDWAWCPLLADFDNDGNKDLFITSGIVKRPVDLDYIKFISDAYVSKAWNKSDKYDDEALEKMPGGSSHPFFYKGDGKLSFDDVSKDWGTQDLKGFYNGASYADLDNDGDLDIVVNSLNDKAVVLQNNAAKQNFVKVAFKGDGMNTAGVGAKAYVFTNGKMQYQELMMTRGFESSSDSRLNFGLANADKVDSILIVWPSQKFQVIKNGAVNKLLVASEKEATGQFNYNQFFNPPPPLFTQIQELNLSWQHKENNFEDFNTQYLLPHKESTRGPKIAVGDVNKDGLDDFYACGAKGQAGALMIQQANGTFVTDTNTFNTDLNNEDVDATFFDADGNGSLDLYIVSGGYEETGSSPALIDRLYINDGSGHFTKSVGALPAIYENKSCVTVADIDRDGDTDIFIGTLGNARAYGVPQTSYLLINDGNAHFSVADQKVMALKNVGMVTAAAFNDLNNDGYPDLVVAGEWMPLTIYNNRNGNFEKTTLPNSGGLWQSVYIDDVNADGKKDILAGNWGWNNKFWGGKNGGPVKLYVNDYDKNGQMDCLLSYTRNGEEYPFLAKDEVERALPLLKKHYLLYAEYAGVVMKDVFYGWIDTVKPIVADRLGSAICYGDGKGNFTIKDLSPDLQLSPLFSFVKANIPNQNMFITGGNFFDVIPYEGRYDAQPLALFSASKNSETSYIPQQNFSELKDQVRDVKWLHTAKFGDILAVARNNSSLQFYKFNGVANTK